MKRSCIAWICVAIWAFVSGLAFGQSHSVAPLLETLRGVEGEGKGNRAASAAWADLVAKATVDQVPEILAATDGSNVLAANWIRAAADAIAERHLHRSGNLPIEKFEAFLGEKQHDPRARRLAYEWIVRADPSASDRLIPGMLDDPSLELRRDAVARLLTAAEATLAKGDKDAALLVYKQALESARDLDQVKLVTDALAKLGESVDLARHFGFVQDWKLLGPFDNAKGKGFATGYPPETKIDLGGSYAGLEGAARWSSHLTEDEYGHVDLNKAVGKKMGVVVYAYSEFRSPRPQAVELRLGTENANKIWLNGKLLSNAEVYHANGAMDQYVGRGLLKEGVNTILLKICQNEQTEDWAQDWKFQLRVCDSTGKAILSADRPAVPHAKKQTAANNLQE